MPVSQLEGLRVGWDYIGDGPALVSSTASAPIVHRPLSRPPGWPRRGSARSRSTIRAQERASAAAGAARHGLLADVAAGLLDSLGVGQAHVFGHSMGGAIAQELALRTPDLVASLQLHCTWGRTDPIWPRLFGVWGRLAAAVGPVAVWEHMLLWAMTPVFYDAHPEVVQQWLELIAGGPPSTADGFRDHVRACVAHDAIDRLGVVTAPTLAPQAKSISSAVLTTRTRCGLRFRTRRATSGKASATSRSSRRPRRSERRCSRSYAVRPSASTKGVDADGEQNDRALEDALIGRVDVQQVEAVADHREKQDAEHRPPDRAGAAEDRRPADDDPGDRVERNPEPA